ncbi:MAG: hypothetical protein DYG88_05915 [Chloroflexi bacterium CFX4]|nr:hypothetical protein [Chloroflexi bacterium CFX4]
MSKDAIRAAYVAVCCLPIVITAWFIMQHGFNVPYWDEWDASAPIAIHTADGTLSPEMLLAPHGQPRIFFTKLTVALSTLLTGWDSRFEMWVSFGLALISLGLLIAIAKRTHAPSAFWLMLPFALLIFSLRQRHNWLMGFQTVWFYMPLFTLAALWVLVRLSVGWRALLLMLMCAVGASYAYLSGMALWIALLPALWLRGYRNWRHYAAWIAAAVACIGLYFTNYTLVDGGLRGTVSLLDYLAYVLLYLGAPLVSESANSAFSALAFAILGLLLVSWNIRYIGRHMPKAALAAPSALLLLSIAAGVITAVGRARFMLAEGLAQPLSSRYVSASNYFWVALLIFGGMAAWQAFGKRQFAIVGLNGVALVVGLVFYTSANYGVLTLYDQAPFSTPQSRWCALNYLRFPKHPCLYQLYPVPEKHFGTMQALAERRLTVYGDWYTDYSPADQPLLANLQPLYGQMDILPVWRTEASDSFNLLQHPANVAEQYLQLPNRERVFFEAAIYVDLANLTAHPDVPQTGANFRLSIRQGRTIHTLYEGSFDVNVETAPIPIRVDLSAWRGKAVVLVYETLVREGNPNFAWATWLNPRLISE